MYKAVQMDDGSIKLVHHGIKGQKWGERRYQYEDGSLTPEGKLRYSLDNGSYSSESRQLRKFNKTGLERSKKLDAAINSRRDRESTGKKLVKSYLLDDSMKLTYDMARSSGSKRGAAFIRSVFDVNLATLGGSIAGGAIGNIAGNILGSRFESEGAQKIARRVGTAIGSAAGAAITRKMTPGEYSLQQRSIRKKVASGRRTVQG